MTVVTAPALTRRRPPFSLRRWVERESVFSWLMAPPQAGPWLDVAVTYYQPFLHKYDDAPMWKVEPRNLPYRD